LGFCHQQKIIKMKVMSWNCSKGMTHKLDEIKHFISKHNPDVLFVSSKMTLTG